MTYEKFHEDMSHTTHRPLIKTWSVLPLMRFTAGPLEPLR
jgi:hypothetical protein